MYYTSELVFEETGCHKKFATDSKGLKRAIDMADSAEPVIDDITKSIGYLMPYVDEKEVSDVIYTVGWALAALKELSSEIRTAKGNLIIHSE